MVDHKGEAGYCKHEIYVEEGEPCGACEIEKDIATLRAQLAARDAEVGRLREAISWVCGEDVEGWPPFHNYTAAGYRYRWRTVLRERLALKGEG